VKDSLDKEIGEVELRAMRDKKPFYSAVVKREDWEPTQLPDWQSAHKDDADALAKAILTSEKSPDQKVPDEKTSSGGATGTTSGSSTSGDQNPPAATTGSTGTSPTPPATGSATPATPSSTGT
jgi:hypothetical protein